MNQKLRVAVVDEHLLLREGLVSYLAGEGNMEVVGSGGDHEDAIHLAENFQPNILVLDLRIPGGGMDAARQIATSSPKIKIVFLTDSEDEEDILEAMRIGVWAYVLKGISGNELIGILNGVEEGESYVPPNLAATLLREIAWHLDITGNEAVSISELTTREGEILQLLSSGLSNREIGERLFLAEKTIKAYITHILHKLQVRNRVEAALLAQRRSVLK